MLYTVVLWSVGKLQIGTSTVARTKAQASHVSCRTEVTGAITLSCSVFTSRRLESGVRAGPQRQALQDGVCEGLHHKGRGLPETVPVCD